jgi:hypothetical protein
MAPTSQSARAQEARAPAMEAGKITCPKSLTQVAAGRLRAGAGDASEPGTELCLSARPLAQAGAWVVLTGCRKYA